MEKFLDVLSVLLVSLLTGGRIPPPHPVTQDQEKARSE